MAIPSTSAAANPSHVFRSNSESTALSSHTYHRLRSTNALHVAAPPGAPPSAPTVPTGSATHLASRQYVEQHRAFVEHQRHLHDEERELWHLERDELHARIQELEAMVRHLGGQIESAFQGTTLPQDAHSISSVATGKMSKTNPSTGDEFWRGAGGQSNAHSTRTFSEPPARSIVAGGNTHLASISEASGTMSPRKKSVGFDMPPNDILEQEFHTHPVPSMFRHQQANGSLDGITFKPAVLATNGTSTKSQSRSRSASPMQKPRTTTNSNDLEKIPSSELREPKPQILDLPASGLSASDLLVKDAGHTPLVRISDSRSSISADLTPKPERGDSDPVETEPRPVRPPVERSDSYFPAVVEPVPSRLRNEVRHADLADDPPLTGLLALSNDVGSEENNEFLSQLRSKLLEAQAQEVTETSEASEASEADAAPGTADHDADTNEGSGPAQQPGKNRAKEGEERDESDEPEPKLKIKRSMNFGSAFGASSVGEAWRH